MEYSLSADQKTLTIFGAFDDSELADGRESHQQLLIANLMPMVTPLFNQKKKCQKLAFLKQRNIAKAWWFRLILLNIVEKPVTTPDKIPLPTGLSETAALPKTSEQSNQLSVQAATVVSLALAAGLSALAYKKEEA